MCLFCAAVGFGTCSSNAKPCCCDFVDGGGGGGDDDEDDEDDATMPRDLHYDGVGDASDGSGWC